MASLTCTTLSLFLVIQITQSRVAYHEKHVVHLIYEMWGLEKVPDAKFIENKIV